MKKTALSLLLSLACACGVAFGAGAIDAPVMEAPRAAAETTSDPLPKPTEKIDYAGQAVLDLNSSSQKMEVTVKAFIDGDTTHFYADGWGSDNVFKARYAAVNTPESTGDIEPWGKKASNYTKNALSNATSIIIESDTDEWKADSTGTRYMSWVWYKKSGSNVYRNLNLELLQEGLAIGSKAGDSRYGSLATPAIAQASALKLNVHSTDPDPDYYYGESIELDLKGLRLNIAEYNGMRVAFEGIVSYYVDQGVYVESYDEETEMYYGIYVYYGFNFKEGSALLAIGNKVRISGVVGEFNGSYQVSSLKYNAFFPSADDVQLKGTGFSAAKVETTATKFNSTVPVTIETVNPDDPEDVSTTTKNYKYAQLALNTSISMKGLKVESIYTTDNGGDNDGAMTLTCKADGKTVNVRTIVLRDSQGNLATEEMLMGKTIDVTGVVDYFNGDYQIKILSTGGIKVDGEPLFPPVTPPAPTPEQPSNSSSDEQSNGCGSVVAISALAPLMAAAFVMMKKHEN